MYPFPPDQPPAWQAIVIHVALLALAVASVVGLLVKRRFPARWWDVWLWVFVGLTAAIICIYGIVQHVIYAPFLTGYMFFVWLVAGSACVMSIRRMHRQGQGVAIWYSLGALVGLGLLIVCLLPAVPSAREAAKRMSCSNNLKQIHLGMSHWHDEFGRFPDAHAALEESLPPTSWRVRLLPYLEGGAARPPYDETATWDSVRNLPAAQAGPHFYRCPSNPRPTDEQMRYYTAYAMLTGPGTAHPPTGALPRQQLLDGEDHTLLVAEVCGQNIVWTEPRDVDANRDALAVNADGNRPGHSPGILSSYHPGGAQVVMAGGRVAFVSKKIDPEVLRALTTAAAGDGPTREP